MRQIESVLVRCLSYDRLILFDARISMNLVLHSIMGNDPLLCLNELKGVKSITRFTSLKLHSLRVWWPDLHCRIQIVDVHLPTGVHRASQDEIFARYVLQSDSRPGSRKALYRVSPVWTGDSYLWSLID